jgi:hypothetical protein
MIEILERIEGKLVLFWQEKKLEKGWKMEWRTENRGEAHKNFEWSDGLLKWPSVKEDWEKVCRKQQLKIFENE